jgi:hypothetical protein
MIELITAISLWELIKHSTIWLVNLKRAKHSRKQESIEALRKVITVTQKTTVYMRQLKQTKQQSHATEAELAILWTELGFALSDLKLHKLAKRCDINGRLWTDPSKMDSTYLEKADAGLERMLQLAKQLLADTTS